MTSVGSAWIVTPSGTDEVGDRDRAVVVDQRRQVVVQRLRQVVRQRADLDARRRVHERAAALGRRARRRCRRAGTSTVSSSVIRTANRSTWSGRRWTGWTWMPCTSTGRGLLAVDREVDEGGRAGAPAEQLELVGVDGDGLAGRAVAVDDGGQRPSLRSGRRPCRSRCGLAAASGVGQPCVVNLSGGSAPSPHGGAAARRALAVAARTPRLPHARPPAAARRPGPRSRPPAARPDPV